MWGTFKKMSIPGPQPKQNESESPGVTVCKGSFKNLAGVSNVQPELRIPGNVFF